MPEVVEKKNKIVKDRKIMGGAARIEGTRIKISDIFSYYRAGKSPEEISESFDLDLSEVHSAISYYYAHPEEMEKEKEEKGKNNALRGDDIRCVFIWTNICIQPFLKA